MKKPITCLLMLLFLSSLALLRAEDLSEDFAYKLAVIHTQTADPENALLSETVAPSEAVVTEFHWIMETLKNRCLNPETAIADTIIATWQKAKKIGYNKSLLELSRELSITARNYKLFGEEKVNFRMTSSYWLKQLADRTKTKTP